MNIHRRLVLGHGPDSGVRSAEAIGRAEGCIAYGKGIQQIDDEISIDRRTLSQEETCQTAYRR